MAGVLFIYILIKNICRQIFMVTQQNRNSLLIIIEKNCVLNKNQMNVVNTRSYLRPSRFNNEIERTSLLEYSHIDGYIEHINYSVGPWRRHCMKNHVLYWEWAVNMVKVFWFNSILKMNKFASFNCFLIIANYLRI